jgi:hypothetical protein
VEQLLADYRTQIANPSPGGAAELFQRSKALTDKGKQLVEESTTSAQDGEAVKECLRKLANLDNPGD